MPTRATTPEPQLTVLRPTQGFADDDDDDSSSISSVDSDTGSESYVVEAIVRRRVEKEGIKYFVKWEGYDESQNTWEPEENLKCPEILAAFRARVEKKKKKKEFKARLSKSAKKLREQREESEEDAEFSEDGMLGMDELQARREKKINEKRTNAGLPPTKSTSASPRKSPSSRTQDEPTYKRRKTDERSPSPFAPVPYPKKKKRPIASLQDDSDSDIDQSPRPRPSSSKAPPGSKAPAASAKTVPKSSLSIPRKPPPSRPSPAPSTSSSRRPSPPPRAGSGATTGSALYSLPSYKRGTPSASAPSTSAPPAPAAAPRTNGARPASGNEGPAVQGSASAPPPSFPQPCPRPPASVFMSKPQAPAVEPTRDPRRPSPAVAVAPVATVPAPSTSGTSISAPTPAPVASSSTSAPTPSSIATLAQSASVHTPSSSLAISHTIASLSSSTPAPTQPPPSTSTPKPIPLIRDFRAANVPSGPFTSRLPPGTTSRLPPSRFPPSEQGGRGISPAGREGSAIPPGGSSSTRPSPRPSPPPKTVIAPPTRPPPSTVPPPSTTAAETPKSLVKVAVPPAVDTTASVQSSADLERRLRASSFFALHRQLFERMSMALACAEALGLPAALARTMRGKACTIIQGSPTATESTDRDGANWTLGILLIKLEARTPTDVNDIDVVFIHRDQTFDVLSSALGSLVGRKGGDVQFYTFGGGEPMKEILASGFTIMPTLAALMSTDAFAAFRMLRGRHPTANVFIHPPTVVLAKSSGHWPTLDGYLRMGAIEVLPCESLPFDSPFRPIGLCQLTAHRPNSYPPLPPVTAETEFTQIERALVVMRDSKMSTCRRFVIAVDKVAASLADKCAKQGIEVLNWNGVSTAMEKAIF